MSEKRIILGPKPNKMRSSPQAEAWVRSRRTEAEEPIKRLTIDLPLSLHSKVKAACAMRGAKMVDEIRELLRQKYGNE